MLSQNQPTIPALTSPAPDASNVLRYADLLEGARDQRAPYTPLAPAERNRRAALRRFLKAMGRDPDDVVGPELRDRFDNALTRYQSWEEAEGTAPSTIRSRRSLLRGYYSALALAAPESSFATTLKEAVRASGKSLNALERETGIGALSLSQWSRGICTPGSLRSRLPSLEHALRLSSGTLASQLPIGRVDEADGLTTSYRQRLRREDIRTPYALLEASSSLRAEWRELLEHKCSALPFLKRDPRGRWNSKSARMCRPFYPAWACTLPDGNVSPSAHATWTQVRQYLGWLVLPRSRGGRALPADVASSLAWLADARAVIEFVRWRAQRSGGLNTGAMSFLYSVASLLHPTTGWVAQSSSLAERLIGASQTASTWPACCEGAFKELRAFTKSIASSARPTRLVEEALKPLLDSGDAIGALQAMLVAMERDMPPASQPVRRAIHQRDIALVSLLLANPLRIAQMTALEVGVGTDQNLTRTPTGWLLVCSGERFKNAATTMSKGIRSSLPASITESLDRYMCEGRETLLGGRTSRLFFVGRWRWDPTRPCENLEDRLQLLTRRYIPACAGFRGHGWRHLLATAWLMEHPGDFGTVADLLGDRIETVVNAYRHVERASSIAAFNAWTAAKQSDVQPKRGNHGKSLRPQRQSKQA